MRSMVIVFWVLAMVMPSIGLSEELIRDEQKVYVPYNKLDEIFGEESRAVIMPYEDFLKLWKAIPDQPEPPPTPIPPVDATLTSARYDGRLESEFLLFNGVLRLQSLRKGWSRLRLGFQNIHLLEAQIKPGNLVLTHGADGYEILLAAPGDYELTVQFAVQILEKSGKMELPLTLPVSPVSKVSLTLPVSITNPTIEPAMAMEIKRATDATKLELMTGAMSSFTLSWQMESMRRGDHESLLYVTAVHSVTATESFERIRSRFSYEVLGEPTTTIELQLPSDSRLIDISGTGIQDWQQRTKDNKSFLTITMQQAEPKYSFETVIETAITQGSKQVPLPSGVAVRREKGFIVFAKATGFQLLIEPGEGVFPAALEDVPELTPDTRATVEQAYYYLNAPVAIKLAINRKLPRVEMEIIHQVKLDEEWLTATYQCNVTVRDAPIFSAALQLPAQVELIEITPPTVINDYRQKPNDKGTLVEIDFTTPVKSETRFSLKCRVRRDSAATSLDVPMISATGINRETGIVVIHAIDKFKLQTQVLEGLLPVSLETVRATGVIPSDFGTIAYRYSRAPVKLTMGIETRSSRVTAEVYSHLEVEQDLLQVTSDIDLNVQYAGVDRFKIKVPESVSDRVEIEGDQIKEKSIKEKADGFAIWEIVMQDTFTGERTITVSYDQKLEVADGKSKVSPLFLEVMEVEREIGYIFISKGSNIEVSAEATELESYDAEELPEEYGELGVILCWKYMKHPFGLELQVTRHEFEDLINTMVNVMHQITVVSTERTSVNYLKMLVRNKGRQYIAIKLPKDTKIFDVMVDGEEARPSLRPSDGMTLIPLQSTTSTESLYTIEILYENQLGSRMSLFGFITIHTPEFHLIPLQRVYTEIYVPRSYVYFPPNGDMQQTRQTDNFYGANTGYANAPVTQRMDSGSALSTKLETLLVKDGRNFRFIKMHAPGKVWFLFMGEKTFVLFLLALFVLPIALGFFLPKRFPITTHSLAIWLACISLVLSLLWTGFYRDLALLLFLSAIVMAILYHRKSIRSFFAKNLKAQPVQSTRFISPTQLNKPKPEALTPDKGATPPPPGNTNSTPTQSGNDTSSKPSDQ